MRRIFNICFLLLILSIRVNASDTESLLDSLDKEVEKAPLYTAKKEAELKEMRQNFLTTSLDLDKYLTSKWLVTAYIRYNSDSAYHYAEICLSYAKKSNDRDHINEAKLYMALTCAIHGAEQQSRLIISECDNVDLLPNALKTLYAKTIMEISIRRMDKDNVSFEKRQKTFRPIWLKYSKYLLPNTIDYLFYQVAGGINDRNALDYVISRLNKYKGPLTPYMATLQQIAYILYKKNNKQQDALEYAIKNAISNIRLANRDDYSLLIIINDLELYGKESEEKTKRELAYLRLTAQNIRLQQDYTKSMWLIVSQALIHENNRLYTDKKMATNVCVIVVLSVLLLLSLCGIAIMWKKMAKAKKDQEEKHNHYQAALLAQQADKSAIEKLQREISLLRQSVDRRDESYLDGITLNVNLVNKMKKQLKKMQNLAMAKKWNDLFRMVNDGVLDDEDYKNIDRSLDHIILTVIPDFVNRFNSLLKPEARIVPDDPKKLTPTLRIYGLISLGISDMGSIANILNYSTQTVYNYRQKIKKSTAIPEDQFEAEVEKLMKSPASVNASPI